MCLENKKKLATIKAGIVWKVFHLSNVGVITSPFISSEKIPFELLKPIKSKQRFYSFEYEEFANHFINHKNCWNVCSHGQLILKPCVVWGNIEYGDLISRYHCLIYGSIESDFIYVANTTDECCKFTTKLKESNYDIC